MTEIILCRHGQTDWNREGRWQGRTDVPLNQRGHQQALELAEALREVPVAAIYSSTLDRAYQTALAIARVHDLRVHRDDRLDEIDQGAWEGMRRDDIVVSHPYELERWKSYPIDLRLPGGETLEEVRQRVRAALDDIILLHAGRTICIVAHSVSMAVVKHELQGLSLPEALRTLPANASWERIPVREYDEIRSARL